MIKKVAAVLIIVIIASLSVAGCTNTTSNVPVTAVINTEYSKAGYTVVTPFTESKDDSGNAVYEGVVDDGAKVLQPYRNTVTIVMARDRYAAMSAYDTSITEAQSNGYGHPFPQEKSWYARIGSSSYPNEEVKITVREPSPYIGVQPYGTEGVHLDLDKNSFAVCTVCKSPIVERDSLSYLKEQQKVYSRPVFGYDCKEAGC